MNKTILLSVVLAIFTLTIFSQEKIKGDRNVTIVETRIDPFNKLIVNNDFDITLIKSFEASVEIEADENLHDVITFNVVNNILEIKTNYNIASKKKLNITVKYTNSLTHLVTNNDATIQAVSALTNDNITITTKDNSEVELNLESKTCHLITFGKSKVKFNIQSDSTSIEMNENSKLEALINGQFLKADLYQSAKANIEGTCSELSLNTMNFSDFTGKNFTCKNSVILAEDSSDIITHTEEQLTLEASGDSEIELYGLPKITINKFSGTTQLKKSEL